MWVKVLLLTSILSVTITFASGFAHLLEAYNKMRLPKDEYLVVQQIYRGWALLGIIVFIALISTFLLTIQTRHQPHFVLNLLSCVCILASLIVFFTLIFPVNQQTKNWEMLPDNWLQLRNRWEFSHITNTILYFIALLMLIIPLVFNDNK
jgi:hypothetical protein